MPRQINRYKSDFDEFGVCVKCQCQSILTGHQVRDYSTYQVRAGYRCSNECCDHVYYVAVGLADSKV